MVIILKNYIKSWGWYFPIPGFFVFIIDFTHFKNVGLNKTEKKVIQFLMESSNLTSAELAEKVSVTKRTIERALKSLQEKNIIERIGSKRDGNRIVIK